MKTYTATETTVLGVGRKVTVTDGRRPVATFYPQAFADGSWSSFTAGIAKRGDRLRIDGEDGTTSWAVGSLDEITDERA